MFDNTAEVIGDPPVGEDTSETTWGVDVRRTWNASAGTHKWDPPADALGV